MAENDLSVNLIDEVSCPICQWSGSKYGDYDCGYGIMYYESECPSCLSHPRHRLVYLYLDRYLKIEKTLALLHFAPEPCLEKLLSADKRLIYSTADMQEGIAMQTENLEALSYGDGTFDLILCLDVLEHVDNDTKAIHELARVMNQSGVCVINVPIDYTLETTFEDETITSPEEISRHFGQYDHVRQYGRDFPARLESAGFLVTLF